MFKCHRVKESIFPVKQYRLMILFSSLALSSSILFIHWLSRFMSRQWDYWIVSFPNSIRITLSPQFPWIAFLLGVALLAAAFSAVFLGKRKFSQQLNKSSLRYKELERKYQVAHCQSVEAREESRLLVKNLWTKINRINSGVQLLDHSHSGSLTAEQRDIQRIALNNIEDVQTMLELILQDGSSKSDL